MDLNKIKMTLIFVHIPKTAGLSLYHELASQIKPAIRFGDQNSKKQFAQLSFGDLQQYRFISGHIAFSEF